MSRPSSPSHSAIPQEISSSSSPPETKDDDPQQPDPPTRHLTTEAEAYLKPNSTDLHPSQTPLPPRLQIPSAPPHPPNAKTLPDFTPLNHKTPSSTSYLLPAAELAEFDPYATPLPAVPPKDLPENTNTPDKGKKRSSLTQLTAGTGRLGRDNDSGAGAGAGPSTSRGEDDRDEKDDDEPVFNFPGFLKDLRMKSAEPIARYLKSFLSNFAKKPFSVNEQIKLIHDFLNFISEKMVLYEPWKSQTPAEFDNAMEAMEKLVMNRLYPYTFTPQLVASQPITTDDLERDSVFTQRVRLFSWIRERHLDVPTGEASQGFLGFAEQELLKINHYKAPRDKMICILNCCKVIFGLIRHVSGADATSADAFVPILIFVVLQANPENMLSNVEYINRFRSPEKLQSEAGYYLSSLQGAIAFIETMDASSLSNITQEEFEKNVESAIQDLPVSPTSQTFRRNPFTSTPSKEVPFSVTTAGEEPARPLSLSTTLALDNTKKFFQRTGNLAQEAVSKPLNAIGKILEGMQKDDNGDEGSEDGSGEEDEDVVDKWKPGERRDRQAERSLNASSGPRYIQRARGVRSDTPDSPSRRFAQLGISPQDSQVNSRAVTPEIPIPDFTDDYLQNSLNISQETYNQTRRANVQTLSQMFPDLEEEIVEDVLEGCGDDLGVAIDRLLEM